MFFFLQNTNNIVYFYQTSFSVRILQEKGFPVSLAIKLRKERHFVQRKKRQRGVGQCLWQWDHQYQVRKPQPCLPNHYSFRMSQGEWCRLCWFILFLSKKTHYFKSVKFLLALKNWQRWAICWKWSWSQPTRNCCLGMQTKMQYQHSTADKTHRHHPHPFLSHPLYVLVCFHHQLSLYCKSTI